MYPGGQGGYGSSPGGYGGSGGYGSGGCGSSGYGSGGGYGSNNPGGYGSGGYGRGHRNRSPSSSGQQYMPQQQGPGYYGTPQQQPMMGGQFGAGMQLGGDVNALLAPLFGMDRAIVRQQVEMMEVFTGIETNNRYVIYNGMGQIIYFAYEDTSAFHRVNLGKNRPFCIRVMNNMGHQIMMLNSSIEMFSRQVIVQIPPGHIVATITSQFGSFIPSFFVNDVAGNLMFIVRSPMQARFGACGNVNFQVLSPDQLTVIGNISKHWEGVFREMYTDADTFGVSFPPTMDTTIKAVLIAVTFVVDFTFYEN